MVWGTSIKYAAHPPSVWVLTWNPRANPDPLTSYGEFSFGCLSFFLFLFLKLNNLIVLLKSDSKVKGLSPQIGEKYLVKQC